MNIDRPSTSPPILVLLGLLILLTGCTGIGGGEPGIPQGSSQRVFEGRLEPVQMTSYMYGSHVLVSDQGRYAVRFPGDMKINLSTYEGTRVRIRGHRVEGYPVDGGPPLISARDVKSIRQND